LSVAYFGRPGLPGQLRDIALEYFLAALRVLQEPLAPGVPLVVLGMSRGSDPCGHTILEYPDAGHSLGYLIPRLPPGLLPPDLVDGPVDQAARADAWPKVADFICRAGGI